MAGGERPPTSSACARRWRRSASGLTHMGPVGCGQVTKVCNQLIVAANSLLIAEAVALAERGGVDAKPARPGAGRRLCRFAAHANPRPTHGRPPARAGAMESGHPVERPGQCGNWRGKPTAPCPAGRAGGPTDAPARHADMARRI
ncbi:MAG: NAD-binding protein [Rivihabitans pingtungensis]